MFGLVSCENFYFEFTQIAVEKKYYRSLKFQLLCSHVSSGNIPRKFKIKFKDDTAIEILRYQYVKKKVLGHAL